MNARYRILVIGSNGFLGRHLVAAIARQGAEAHGFDPGNDTNALLASHFCGSVVDPAHLNEALRKVKPDAVISLAAYVESGLGPGISAERDPDAAFSVNVEGFRNTIHASRKHGVARIVWSSSTTVLGSHQYHPGAMVDEDARRVPENVYALTKTLAEDIGTFEHGRNGLEVIAVRPTLVLGRAHTYQGILDPLKALFAAKNGHLEVSWGSHRFDIVDTRDCGDAMLALAMAPQPLRAIYHVNGGATDIHAIVEVVKSLRHGLTVDVNETDNTPFYPLVSSDRIHADIGFRAAFTPDDIIRNCVN